MEGLPVIIKLDCPDRVGLVARITGFAAERGLNLVEVSQFTDVRSQWFFARLVIERAEAESLRREFESVGRELKASWTVRPAGQLRRAAILVGKEDHCLADLLWRWRSRELPIEIPVVASNHEVCRELVEREGIAFRCIPVQGSGGKERHFELLAKALRQAAVELVIMARYMQILPGWFCREFAGRLINIHHSFLPAFVGANPYLRAHERGVKLIGATCHYATEDLDSGPIIEQEVARVEHYHEPEDLRRLGRDCERVALARGVRYHVEDRVLLHANRAVVFRD